jgi:hypothetical protein
MGPPVPHTRNNWICYDFKNRNVAPAHYEIHSAHNLDAGCGHIKSWLVETSMNGTTRVGVDHREGNSDLNGRNIARVFKVSKTEQCLFIKLVTMLRCKIHYR